MITKIILIIFTGIYLFGCGNGREEKTEAVKAKGTSKNETRGSETYRYIQEGVEHNNKGKYSEAIESLKKALEINDGSALVKENLITVYGNYCVKLIKEEDFETAELVIREASGIFPEDTRLKKIYGRVLTEYALNKHNEGNKERARCLLEDAVVNGEGTADSYSLLGNIYYGTEDNEKAISCWEKALELDSSRSNTRRMLEKIKREYSVESSFQSQELEHFEVRFNGVETYDFAWDVLKVLDDAYYEIGGEFDALPPKKYTVIIYTGKEFEKALMIPDWIRGLYDGKIRIRIGDLKGDIRKLKELLYHEYTHALLHYMLGDDVPVWLHEGVAQYEEPGSFVRQDEKNLLVRNLKAGSLLSLSEINWVIGGKKSSVDRIFLAYIQAKSLMHYIAGSYSKYSIRSIVKEFAESKDINTAIERALGINLKQLELNWRESLK